MILGTHRKTSLKRARAIAFSLLGIFVSELFFPTAGLALSGGPAQPEFRGFEQASPLPTDAVDLFTGDFAYNLPLFEIDGYPINMVYKGNASMEDEAGWVGLGWTLNPGAINRTVRGIPDDFKGETVTEEYNQKKEVTISIDASVLAEFAGNEVNEQLSAGLSVNHSTRRGLYFGLTAGGGISGGGGSIGFDLSNDAASGYSVVPRASIAAEGISASTYYSYSARTGTQQFGMSVGGQIAAGNKFGINSGSGSLITTRIPIGESTYFPYGKPRMQITSHAYSIKVGGIAITATDVMDVSLKGNYYVQKVREPKSEPRSALGYLYMQHATGAELTDFNRDGDNESFFPGMTNLPPSALTYDLYSISGQGIGGMVRPHRSETGTVSDISEEIEVSFNPNLGGELALGYNVKIGADAGLTTENLNKKPWSLVHDPYGKYDGQPLNTLQQNYYFTKGGETTPINESHFQALGGMNAKAFALTSHKSLAADGIFPTRNQHASADPFQRMSSNELFNTLDAQTAQHVALDKKILSHTTAYSLAANTIDSLDRVGESRKTHHLSELTSTQADGSRYVFGIPAMNNSKRDVTFNASGGTVLNDRLITYTPGSNSTSNTNGNDNLFYSKTVPAHTHTHLLTAYLGPDYIDLTGNGVTDDDMGTAVRFNWTRTYSSFKWRSPVASTPNVALYSEASQLSVKDEKGSYTYGDKEIWMMHSIESKNYVAFFELSDRSDALGVVDENGAIDTNNRQQKLDRIAVYSKKEWQEKGMDAVPIKTVDFFYDYSLCSGVPNNLYALTDAGQEDNLITGSDTLGKLTLRKVVIGYGNSTRGVLSPYEFSYGFNPAYDPEKTDRWGNYKGVNPGELSFSNYTYVNEGVGESTLNDWAAAWQLNEIILPSGAKMSVQYECDEYAYVQDKRAQKMFEIKGIGKSKNEEAEVVLHRLSVNSSEEYQYLYIDRPANLPDAEIYDLIAGMDWLYFRIRVRLPSWLGRAEGVNQYEYIRGYAELEEIGICPNDSAKLYLKISNTAFNKKGDLINPIVKAALDYTYLNHQELIFGSIHPDDEEVTKTIKNIIAIKDDILSLFVNPYKVMIVKGMSRKLDRHKSFIRLNHPDKRKKGGGHRVSQITVTDRWAEQTGSEQSTTYGQRYRYDDESGMTTGVASYEPMEGNDENPFKEPDYYPYDNSNSKKPKPRLYQERPYGELFFPPAIVGYAKVTVVDLHKDNAKSVGTYTENAFYTARDFPLSVEYTEIDTLSEKIKPINTYLGYGAEKRYQATSQGYVLKFNNMHGKPRSVTTWNEQKGYATELLSSTEYRYHTAGEGNELDNRVRCIHRDGSVRDTLIGMEYDLTLDNTFAQSSRKNKELQANTSGFIMIGPVVLPFFWFRWSSSHMEYRTAVATKIIQQYGILRQVVHRDQRVRTTVTNEIFDAETGSPVQTNATTEFYDLVERQARPDLQFKVNYPAYYATAHERMGHAYRNTDYRGKVGMFSQFIDAADYQPLDAGSKQYLKEMIYRGFLDGLETGSGLYSGLSGNLVQGGVFTEGDEVYNRTDHQRYWVAEVLSEGDIDQILSIVNQGSNPVTGSSPVGQPPTLPPPPGSDPVYTLCGDQSTDDTLHASIYASLVNLSQIPALQNPAVLNDIPFTAQVNPAIDAFTSGMPTYLEFYDLWAQTGSSALYHYMRWFTENEDARLFLADLYGNSAKQEALLELLECQELRECLLSEMSNTVFMQALEYLFADMGRASFVMYLANHYNRHYVVTGVSSSSDVCDVSGGTGVYGIGGGSACYLDVMSYNMLLDQGLGALNPAPSFSGNCNTFVNIGAGVPGIVDENLCDPVDGDFALSNATAGTCPTLTPVTNINLFTAVFPGPNTVDDPQDYTYNQPGSNELVMFINRYGDIMDLGGDTVQVIRSGRRNMQGLSAGEETWLNKSPFRDTITNASKHGLLNASAVTYSDDWPSDFFGADSSNQRFNPFVYGQRGIFRPSATYAPSGDREYSTSLNSRADGTILNYVPFWEFGSNDSSAIYRGANESDLWIAAEEFTRYSGLGEAVESKNPLGIFSAQMYAQNNQVVGVAVNARHTDMLFESFEDYDFGSGLKSTNGLSETYELQKCSNGACTTWVAGSAPDETPGNGDAHAGLQSLLLRGSSGSGGDAYFSRPYGLRWKIPLSMGSHCYDSELYRIPGFVPDENKRYLVSLWVKVARPDISGYDPLADIAQLNVRFLDGSSNSLGSDSVFTPSGPMIDGWMRIQGEFTMYPGTDFLSIQLKAGTHGVYADDLRIYPAAGKMLTYVPHPSKIRLQAELDENNYAVFYKYDHDGMVMKVERETENGRLTLKENVKANAARY